MLFVRPDFNDLFLNALLGGAEARDARVEVIANSQGNRITPSYVACKENEKLVDAKLFDANC